jgi:hypothetical protein
MRRKQQTESEQKTPKFDKDVKASLSRSGLLDAKNGQPSSNEPKKSRSSITPTKLTWTTHTPIDQGSVYEKS